MNSPSVAFIWEVYRKERWGFALLLLVLAVCAALSLRVAHLKDKVLQMDARAQNLSGSIAASQILLSSSTGLVAQVVQVKLDPGSSDPVVIDVRVAAGDRLSWTGLGGEVYGRRQIRLSHGATTLFDGVTEPPATLSWSVGGDDKRHGRITINPGYTEGDARARATAQSGRETLLTWSMVLMGFSVLVVFAIFGCAEPHRARGFTGIPARKFTLPVRTGLLVFVPIALGCLTMLLFYFAWARLVLPPLLPDQIKMPDVYFALLLCAGLVVFQACVWGLASFPRTRLCCITVLVLGLSPLVALPFEFQRRADQRDLVEWLALQPKLIVMLACAWVFGLAAACVGVRRERHGEGTGWKELPTLKLFIDWSRPRPLEFRSALHAQFWIEFRRNGRVALLLWTVLMCAVLANGYLASVSWWSPYSHVDAIAVCVVLGGLAWMATAGLNLARDGISKKPELSSFTATRPISTGTLLTAKLLAGAAVWIVAAVLLAASLSALPGTNILRSLPMRSLPVLWSLPVVLLLAISLHLFVGILPLCLSGRIPGFPWSLLPWLVVYGAATNALIWFHTPDRYQMLFALFLVLLLLKLGIAYWGFRRAIGLRLISRAFVARYVAYWCIGTGAVGLFVCLSAVRMRWPNDNEALVWIASVPLVLPLARIALAPLALAINRHR
jgi:hypothetical protein